MSGDSFVGSIDSVVSWTVIAQLVMLIDVDGMSTISLSVNPACVIVIGYVPVFADDGTVNLIVSIVP